MKRLFWLLSISTLFSCSDTQEKTRPESASITESIYASGFIKSKDQYQAYATVNGIIENIYVQEGDTVKKGQAILSISNETQKLNQENAELSADYADYKQNIDKLNDSKLLIRLSENKMNNDSILFYRQKKLWQQQVETQIELEQKELAFQNSKAAYYSALIKYDELNRQLKFSSLQAQKNLKISSKLAGDFILRSELDGIVYTLLKYKGEIVSPQIPLAIIGDAKNFILEMQVDEYDIFKIKKGLPVFLTLDSYKGNVFEAIISRISPTMNERSKTFVVEAEFVKSPELLYPNITFEANIILQVKEKALLIPRNYLLNDSTVLNSEGLEVRVKTGLKDYQKIEILSGITENDEILKPGK